MLLKTLEEEEVEDATFLSLISIVIRCHFERGIKKEHPPPPR